MTASQPLAPSGPLTRGPGFGTVSADCMNKLRLGGGEVGYRHCAGYGCRTKSHMLRHGFISCPRERCRLGSCCLKISVLKVAAAAPGPARPSPRSRAWPTPPRSALPYRRIHRWFTVSFLQGAICSGSKDEACACVGAQELVRHLGLRHFVERLTGAVQWNDVVDVDTL